MTEILTGQDFVVNADIVSSGQGTCPLLGPDGQCIGDLNGRIRVNSRMGDDWPEAFVDQGDGSYFRLSLDGVGYGTSVVGCAGFHTLAETHFIPRVSQVEFAGDAESVTLSATGTYHERDMQVAALNSVRTWRRPAGGHGPAIVDLSATLSIEQRLPLSMATQLIDSDRFRWFMLSSMYVNDITYDSNLLQFEDADGVCHEVSISAAYDVNGSRRRNGHLFPRAIPLGSWLELTKTEGSTWLPRTASIRYDLKNTHGLTLGIQGWWSGSDNPDDDNLNVWLEWIDPPRVLEPGMDLTVDISVTSLPCTSREIIRSRPAWPRRLWWKPTDYAHRMENDYALDS